MKVCGKLVGTILVIFFCSFLFFSYSYPFLKIVVGSVVEIVFYGFQTTWEGVHCGVIVIGVLQRRHHVVGAHCGVVIGMLQHTLPNRPA